MMPILQGRDAFDVLFWQIAGLVLHEIHLYGLDVVEAFEDVYATTRR